MNNGFNMHKFYSPHIAVSVTILAHRPRLSRDTVPHSRKLQLDWMTMRGHAQERPPKCGIGRRVLVSNRCLNGRLKCMLSYNNYALFTAATITKLGNLVETTIKRRWNLSLLYRPTIVPRDR